MTSWKWTLALVLAACSGSAAPAAPGSSETRSEEVEAVTPTENPLRVEPPSVSPYDYATLSAEEHDDVCAHTAEPASGDACEADSDCRICHDGSSCGIAANVGTLQRRGADCMREDAAQCEYAAVRCCSGQCQVVSR